jgi:hypothetical protein
MDYPSQLTRLDIMLGFVKALPRVNLKLMYPGHSKQALLQPAIDLVVGCRVSDQKLDSLQHGAHRQVGRVEDDHQAQQRRVAWHQRISHILQLAGQEVGHPSSQHGMA